MLFKLLILCVLFHKNYCDFNVDNAETLDLTLKTLMEIIFVVRISIC